MVMGNKFIYAFRSDTRDQLISLGFKMIKSDEDQNIYIFENNSDIAFFDERKEFAYSNTLMF